MRLTDTQVLALHTEIQSRYDEDIAQAVIVEVLKNRENELIRNWTSWTRRAAYRIWHKQKQHEALLVDLDTLQEHLANECEVDEIVNSRLALKNLFKNVKGIELMLYLSGERKASRVKIHRLRKQLLSELE